MPIDVASWAQSHAIRFRSDPNSAPVAILIVMPFVMASFGQEWLYTPIGTLDPWYNIGFFLSYHDSGFLADHYKVQRLPWILPGWLLYQTIGPLAANFVLHVGALVVSTVFVYLTLSRLVRRQAAFLAAAFLTVYIPFHGSGGWDYQTAGAGAYYAVTLCLLTRAAQSPDPRNGLIGGGIAFAAAFFASIQLVNFIPVLAALYFVVRERDQTREAVRTALIYSLIGFGGLTLALCVVNLSTGRSFFFFWPLLKIVLERVADPVGQKPWMLPWSSFFVPPAAFLHLVIPGVVLLASLLRLITAVVGIKRLSKIRVWLLCQYVFSALLWALWQELGHTALHPSYFAHPLIVPAFLALGGLLAEASKEDIRVSMPVLVGGLFLAFVPMLQSEIGSTVTLLLLDVPILLLMLGIAASILVLFLAASLVRDFLGATLVVFAAATFTFSYLQLEMISSHVQGGSNIAAERYRTKEECVSNAQSFREVIRLFNTLHSEGARTGRAMIWRGPSGERTFLTGCKFDLNNLRGSIHSAGVNNLGFATDTHPREIPDDYVASVIEGGVVIAVVQNDGDAEGLIERLAYAGKKLVLIRRDTIDLGKVPLLMLFYRSWGATCQTSTSDPTTKCI